jgi:hypothetical protein
MDRSPSDADALRLLRDADLTVVGLLSNASNHTMLVQLDDHEGRFAVYKPRRGERPLRDFPAGTLHRREVAAFVVSDFLGWGLVPPTVLRDGPYGVGSVQQFVLHDPRQHYFTLVEDPGCHGRLAQLAVFDLLVNNADRKGGHVLCPTDSSELVGIDHGLTFHAQPKLRTVIWELGGTPIDARWRADLRRLHEALDGTDDERLVTLDDMLDADERTVLTRRARLLADTAALPEVAEHRRPYPWPPV